MSTFVLRLLLVGLVLLPTACNAQPAKDEAAREADALPRIAVTDSKSLRSHVGEQVTAFGSVSRTGKSGSGINFLNFAGAELTVVCRRENVAKFDRAPADLYDGETVEVIGEVEIYKGKMQITLTDPGQIAIVDTSRPAVPLAKVELEKLGENHWVSPAGLHYTGRDPDGRTRLEHVLRHAEDDPRRDGPHGVFDGGRDGALAAIDEAWRLADKRNTRPETEGGRSAYTILLGRDIGYLGGRTGAERQHPKLQRVLIVVEKDTHNVVTAYPK